MSHLTSDRITQIENNLLRVKSLQDGVVSMWINVFLFVFIVGGSIFALYNSYKDAPKHEKNNIEFKPQLWRSKAVILPLPILMLSLGQICCKYCLATLEI